MVHMDFCHNTKPKTTFQLFAIFAKFKLLRERKYTQINFSSVNTVNILHITEIHVDINNL